MQSPSPVSARVLVILSIIIPSTTILHLHLLFFFLYSVWLPRKHRKREEKERWRFESYLWLFINSVQLGLISILGLVEFKWVFVLVFLAIERRFGGTEFLIYELSSRFHECISCWWRVLFSAFEFRQLFELGTYVLESHESYAGSFSSWRWVGVIVICVLHRTGFVEIKKRGFVILVLFRIIKKMACFRLIGFVDCFWVVFNPLFDCWDTRG